MARAQDVDVRVQLVGPEQRSGSRHRHGMPPRGAPFRGDQVVPAVALVEMRRFRQAERSALEDVVPCADESPLRWRVLLQHDASKAVLSGTVVPEHVQQVLAPVVVVKERWIEPAAVQINRIRPVAIDTLARDEIVMEVAQRGARRACGRRPAVALHVGVNQMKEAVGMRQARCPDAARVGIAAHVELTRAIERPGDEAPVDEIARVMNLHAGEPLERRRRDVVVVADAHDRRIRIETAKDWIGNRVRSSSCYAAAAMVSGRRSRTSVHRRTAPSRSSAARPMKNGV